MRTLFHKDYEKKVPIYRKLFMIFSSFALIPVLFIGGFSLIVSYRITYENLQSSIRDSLVQTGMMADVKLEEMRYVSQNFALNSEIKRLLRLPMTEANILLLQQEMDKFSFGDRYTITLCGNNGLIYTNWYTDGMIYHNGFVEKIRNTEWYAKMETVGSQVVWIPHMENIAGYDSSESVVTLARNIVNNSLEGEDILGFVTISVPSVPLSGILDGISGIGYVVDENGKIVMSQEEEEIGSVLEVMEFKNPGIQKVEIDGVSYMGGIQENNVGGLYTVVLVPSAELYSQILISVVIICFAVILSMGIIFSVAYHASKLLSKPILALESAMQSVQKGSLEKVSMETDIKELISLKDNFNIMVDRVDKLIAEKITEEQKRKEIEVEKAKAELKFLRAQITPHFLFNTLNSIKWLAVIHGANPVAEMITALGQLLECSMQKGNDFIPLKEEVENVKAYLKIQEMRYGSRIHSKWEIEEAVLADVVPKLILQPLAENAIIHGVDKNPDGGLIIIRCYEEEEMLILEVEDDGPGIMGDMMKPVQEDRSHKNFRLSGIGAANVNKRIQFIYGKNYGLFYQKPKTGNGTLARLILKGEKEHAESTVGG